MCTKGTILVLSGLSGAGKSTLGGMLYDYLAERGRQVALLDGDQTRRFFDGALGYSPEDRLMVSKMIAFGACLLAEQGHDVILATMLSQPGAREFLAAKTEFIEIHLDTRIQHCIQNDAKDVYKNHLDRGEPNLVGVDLSFAKPANPDKVVRTHVVDPEESFGDIVDFLAERMAFGLTKEQT